jgi:CRISPR/Cas system-associated exonuclease Cas4 (RecB family)
LDCKDTKNQARCLAKTKCDETAEFLFHPIKFLFIFDLFKFITMPFLQKLAKAITQNNDIAFHDTAVILPNRRAVKLLRQAMAQEIGKAFFSPVFYTIDDFIDTLCPLKKADKMVLLFKLYEVYQASEQGKDKDFHSFVSWGSVFIQDINEIDMQLANADDIFTNLADIKEIDNIFLKQHLSQNTLSYIEFYKSLNLLYHNFNEVLRKDQTGYTGLIYKDTAENIETYASQLSHKRYIFAGFNMFSPAELKIARYYRERFHAEFYFDLDKLYFNEEKKDSYMVQQMELAFNELGISREKANWIGDDYRDIPKNICVTGASQQMNQVLYATELLNKMPAEELDHTAVVLADESLFLPFIHTYGKTRANYTMGYPLKATAAYSLLEILINAAKNGERFRENQQSPNFSYYHRDLIAFFRNPIIQEMMPTATAAIDKIIKGNRTFIEYEDVAELEQVHYPRFTAKGIDYFQEMRHFFEQLADTLPKERQGFYALQYILNGLQQIDELLSAFGPTVNDFDLKSIEYIITEKLSGISIPLSGTPDSGLQVMGLLETRTLDFKNIIMLSVNESILPKGRSQNSLIMHSLKQHFNLPTYHYRDAVIAYHFFRLLQHAENVHLIYNNDSSDTLSEKSRFIHQLDFEIKKRDLPINFTEETLAQRLQAQSASVPITITKDENILQKLKGYWFSPTAISTYIRCPLKFYLEKIAGIKKPETVNETIESSVIGTIIHAILEHLYTDIKKRPEQGLQAIAQYRKDMEQLVHEQFVEAGFSKKDLSRGKLYLAYEVVKKNLTAYFKMAEDELKQGYTDIIGTEIGLHANIDVNGNSINFYGKSDRIDFRDQCVTIFDYKTGWVDAKHLVLKSLDDLGNLFTDSNYDKLFQLLMYAYMYAHDHSDATVRKTTQTQCGIISFQEIMKKEGTPILFAHVPETEITESTLKAFEESLKLLLAEILDPDKAFVQTDKGDNCNYCDFRQLCRIQSQAE